MENQSVDSVASGVDDCLPLNWLKTVRKLSMKQSTLFHFYFHFLLNVRLQHFKCNKIEEWIRAVRSMYEMNQETQDEFPGKVESADESIRCWTKTTESRQYFFKWLYTIRWIRLKKVKYINDTISSKHLRTKTDWFLFA